MLWILTLWGCATYTPTCEPPEISAATADVTWHQDIAPLVAEHCAGCHYYGGIAPFPLTSYLEASEYAEAMAVAAEQRNMPPFPPTNCGECNQFQHARVLDDDEIGLLMAWADQGAPEGEPEPPPPTQALPTLDREDAIVDIGADFTPPLGVRDSFRCFVVDPVSDSKKFMTGYDVRPGSDAIVHHVILYTLDSDGAVTTARDLDAADEGPGYECFGGANAPATFSAGWAPGAGALTLPEGTGLELPAGRPMVVQVHYHVESATSADRTLIALQLEDEVQAEASIVEIKNTKLNLTPGKEEIVTIHREKVKKGGEITVWGVFAHMHEAGKSFQMRYKSQGEDSCLIDIPVWDYHWQGFYLYDEPLTVKQGGELSVLCSFNTMGRAEVTKWGEGTEDEMCIGFLYVSAPLK